MRPDGSRNIPYSYGDRIKIEQTGYQINIYVNNSLQKEVKIKNTYPLSGYASFCTYLQRALISDIKVYKKTETASCNYNVHNSFSSGMVLQRDKPVKVWGTGEDCKNELSCITEQEAFSAGFILAARIMVEVMQGFENEDILEK